MLECTPHHALTCTHTHMRERHTHTQRTSLCFVQIPLQYQVFPKAIAISRKKQGDRHSFPWLVGWAGLLADAILDYAGRWPLTCLSACVDICFHFKSCGPFLLKFIVFVLFYLEIVGALMCVAFQVFREQPVQEAENSLYHCPLRGLRPIG